MQRETMFLRGGQQLPHESARYLNAALVLAHMRFAAFVDSR